jgi:hypothetical protein
MGTKTDDQTENATLDESWTSLGLCHYGGENEDATTMASREDGTGWIAVCDQHKDDAKKDGFQPEA